MKRLIAIPVVLVVLLGALIAGPNFIDWNQYKDQARAQAEGLTGLSIEIKGDLSLALLPSPRVYIQEVVVKNSHMAGEEVLAALKMLDVRVALLPLLSGDVVVKSVHLDSPQIRLSKDTQGRLSYLTPQIEALMTQPKDSAQPQKAVPVSFQNISIENGAFYYKDAAAKAPLEAQKINVDLSANTLAGPFVLDGSLLYADQLIEVSGKTGVIDQATHSTSLNAQLALGGLSVDYAGVVTLGQAPEVQGEIALIISSIEDLMAKNTAKPPSGLSGRIEVKGVLSANAEQAALKNAVIVLAGQTLEGEISAGLKPLSLKGSFTGSDTLDLDKFMKGGSAQALEKPQGAGFSIPLPQTLTLPVLGAVDLKFELPAVVYNQQIFKTVLLDIVKAEKGFALEFSAAEIPGKGAVKASVNLEYADKTLKGDSELYAGPRAQFALKGQLQNTPEAVQAFTGLRDLPMIKDSRVSLFDISGQVASSALILDKGVVNLDDKAFSLSGSYKAQKDSPRPLLNLKILADSLNFDELTGGASGASAAPSNGDPLQPLKALVLPYDLILDANVNAATAQGYAVEGVKVSVAISPNTLTLNDVGAQNFAGSALSLKGKIADLKNLGGLDLAVSVNSPDPYKLAEALKIDSASWPKNLGAIKVNAKAKGNIAALDTNASVSALGGEVIFKGVVANPVTQATLSGVALQVKHPNMAQALKNFGASAPNYRTFSGPIDAYTDLEMTGKVTTLSGLKATLAGTTMTGALRYDASAAVPAVSGQLKFGRLVLQSAHGVAASSGQGTQQIRPTAGAGGKWSTLPIDSGYLHNLSADLQISAESMLYETWDMKAPAMKVSLHNGTLDIEDLKAGLFDGQLAMQGQLASTAKDKPLGVQMAAKITQINMGALAKALSGTGRVEAEGDVSFDYDISGRGLSQSEIVNSLKGQAQLTGTDVVMKGFDMAGLATALMDSSKPLDRLQQILGASTSGGSTAFDTVKGAYTINAGVVNIDTMIMDGPEAMIVSKGNANLPRWFLDTLHTVTLKNAQKIEAFDVTIKGPLDNPANTFGKGMFQTLMREKVQDKVIEKLPGLLGDDVSNKLQQFGILPQKKAPVAAPIAVPVAPVAPTPAPSQAAPAAEPVPVAPMAEPEAAQPEAAPVAEQPAAEPESKSDEEKAQEAIEGLMNNLLQ